MQVFIIFPVSKWTLERALIDSKFNSSEQNTEVEIKILHLINK